MRMTMEERVAAALKAVDAVSGFVTRGYIDADDIETALRAGIPELFSDPPTAWLAPWHYGADAHRHLLGELAPVTEAAQTWEAFRDAFLKGGDDAP